MNRRSLLGRMLAGAAALPVLPLAFAEQKVDPVLRAILENGGRVVVPEWTTNPDSLWRAEVWVGPHIVGYIAKAGNVLQLCTATWPRQ